MSSISGTSARFASAGSNTITEVFNVSVPTAGVEMSQSLPANCRGFVIKCRGSSTLKIGYALGESLTNYVTISPGSAYSDDHSYFSQVIYFNTSKDGETVEIVTFS